MVKTGEPIDLIYTFQGNSRSEAIINELCGLRQKLGLTDDRTMLMVVVSWETPVLREALKESRGTVALVDRDLPSRKHLRFVPGRTHGTDGLPEWASAAKYVVKVGHSCNNVQRSAQQILALFITKYQDHMARFPLPWGPAEDQEARKRREEKEKNRKRDSRRRKRHMDSPLLA